MKLYLDIIVNHTADVIRYRVPRQPLRLPLGGRLPLHAPGSLTGTPINEVSPAMRCRRQRTSRSRALTTPIRPMPAGEGTSGPIGSAIRCTTTTAASTLSGRLDDGRFRQPR
jgi:hypothetical protein